MLVMVMLVEAVSVADVDAVALIVAVTDDVTVLDAVDVEVCNTNGERQASTRETRKSPGRVQGARATRHATSL